MKSFPIFQFLVMVPMPLSIYARKPHLRKVLREEVRELFSRG